MIIAARRSVWAYKRLLARPSARRISDGDLRRRSVDDSMLSVIVALSLEMHLRLVDPRDAYAHAGGS